MSVDAMLTQLGPSGLLRWTFDSETEYRQACVAESEFIQSLETELSRQLNCKVSLHSLLSKEQMGVDDTEELYTMVIGGSEGLKWLQDSVRTLISCGDAHEVEQFQHILNHSPVSGIYIPMDFPRPFTLQLRGDIVSVGSLFQLERELTKWEGKYFQNHIKGNTKIKKILREYSDNFSLVINEAKKQDKAIELL